MRRIVAMQPRLAKGQLGRLARSELAATALDVLEIDRLARGLDTAVIGEMRTQLAAELGATEIEPAPGGGLRRGAPFRRGRRPMRR